MMPTHRDPDPFMLTYDRLDLEISTADGIFIVDTAGKRYYDFVCGLGVQIFGHNHPKITEAIQNQLSSYSHVSNLFVQPVQTEMAESLRRISGYDGIFFSNSGTESIEGCIKMVRKWSLMHNKDSIIACSNGFHGRTMGSLSLMDREKYRLGYGPFLDGISICPFNNPEVLSSLVNESTAAVFIEFIQGEGGIIPATSEFINVLFSLRKKFGFLVVADEIQIGMGRTGRVFGFQHWNVVPDVVAVAKALGGGLPLGAILVHRDLKHIFGIGGHGSTFGGNPLACAAGNAMLRLLSEFDMSRLCERVFSSLSEAVRNTALRFPGYITEVRGSGCLLGIEVKGDARMIQRECLAKGLLISITQGNVIRLFPPVICSEADLLNTADILCDVLATHAS
jgi:acetylornithine/N-succinyldiaminopimelate aminotransferase